MEFKITATKETRNKSKDPESVSLTVTAATTVAQLKTLIAKDRACFDLAPARLLRAVAREPAVVARAVRDAPRVHRVE